MKLQLFYFIKKEFFPITFTTVAIACYNHCRENILPLVLCVNHGIKALSQGMTFQGLRSVCVRPYVSI